MGGRQFGTPPRKARPILSGRDYDSAKRRLADALQQPGWIREDERIDALILALAEFETRYVSREPQRAVEWAECVFVPAVDSAGAPRRRWSDQQPQPVDA